MPNLPELVKNHCATCEAETERIVNNLVQELADLKAAHEQEIDEWRHNQDMCFKTAEELEGQLKERGAEIERLKQQPQQSEAVTKLLELMKIDVERQERIILHDPRLIELLKTYREIVPA